MARKTSFRVLLHNLCLYCVVQINTINWLLRYTHRGWKKTVSHRCNLIFKLVIVVTYISYLNNLLYVCQCTEYSGKLLLLKLSLVVNKTNSKEYASSAYFGIRTDLHAVFILKSVLVQLFYCIILVARE